MIKKNKDVFSSKLLKHTVVRFPTTYGNILQYILDWLVLLAVWLLRCFPSHLITVERTPIDKLILQDDSTAKYLSLEMWPRCHIQNTNPQIGFCYLCFVQQKGYGLTSIMGSNAKPFATQGDDLWEGWLVLIASNCYHFDPIPKMWYCTHVMLIWVGYHPFGNETDRNKQCSCFMSMNEINKKQIVSRWSFFIKIFKLPMGGNQTLRRKTRSVPGQVTEALVDELHGEYFTPMMEAPKEQHPTDDP